MMQWQKSDRLNRKMRQGFRVKGRMTLATSKITMLENGNKHRNT